MRKFIELTIGIIIGAFLFHWLVQIASNQKCFKDEGVDVIYWRWETSKRLCGIAYQQSMTLAVWSAQVEGQNGIETADKGTAEAFVERYCPVK